MKTGYWPLFLIIASIFTTGCFKEDEKITPHIPGEGKSITIALEGDYKYRSWVQLATGTEIYRELKTTYDLEFENGSTSWKIHPNTSLFMKVAITNQQSPENVTDTIGLKWAFDSSNGYTSGNAFMGWCDTITGKGDQLIRVIDRGIDLKGRSRGYYKIILDSVTSNGYYVKYGLLKSTVMKALTINKTDQEESVRLLLDETNPIISGSIHQSSYDLQFGQYTTLLYTSEGAPYPYLVTGVLINQKEVDVAIDSLRGYNNIDLEAAKTLTYSNRKDIIGYNWKQTVGDVTTGNVSYVIRQGLTYVLRKKDGLYYKMQFLKFYNDSGEKGYPMFLLAPL